MEQPKPLSAALWQTSGQDIYDGYGRSTNVPQLELAAQQPEDWSMLQLHWREKYIRNDIDREAWLFGKYNDGTLIHPHTKESREFYYDRLQENMVSEWRCGRRIQWSFGCGCTQRCLPVFKDRMWVVLFFVWSYIWSTYGIGLMSGMYPSDPAVDPIPMSAVWARTVSTIEQTMAWTGATIFAYQIPRLYRHCFKCRLRPKTELGQKKLNQSKDRAMCSIGPILCCLGTFYSRLRRSRLEKCSAYDQSLDEEAATFSYIYDSDCDDPDEFLYYEHIKHTTQTEKQKKKKAKTKRNPKSYIIDVTEESDIEKQSLKNGSHTRVDYDDDDVSIHSNS